MKQLLITLILVLAATLLLAGQDNLPRVFVQKLVLEDGSNPVITVDKELSAPEYNFQVWIKERPEEILDSDKQNFHFLKIGQIGDGIKFPLTVVCQFNLGNFNAIWHEGETIHLKITHKATEQVKEWDYVIPTGTALIKLIDEPMVIPPFTAKQEIKTDCHECGGCQ